jgi:hypothetical protein
MRIGSNGRVGINEDTPVSQMQVTGAESGTARGIRLHQNSDDSVGVLCTLFKTRDVDPCEDDDIIGEIQFKFFNDDPVEVDGVRIYADIADVANGDEKADLFIEQMIGGSLTNVMSIVQGNTWIGTDSGNTSSDIKLTLQATTGAGVHCRREDTSVVSGNGLGIYAAAGQSPDTNWHTVATVYMDSDGTWTNSSTPSRIRFYTTPSGSTTQANVGTFDSTGYLGLNTTSPATRLHVEGSTQAAARCRVNHTGTGGNNAPGYELYNEGGFVGGLFYRETSDTVDLFYDAGTDAAISITTNGAIGTGNETSPDVNTGGLCLNHGAADGKVFTVKNSDVDHPFTDYAEADTYGYFKKNSAGSGGFQINGLSEADVGVRIDGYAETQNTAATGVAPITINGYYTNGGTGRTSLPNDANVISVQNNATTLMSMQGDGTMNMLDNELVRPVLKDYGEAVNAIGSIGGGTQDIDLEDGNVVTGTVDTSTTTFTFSNPPASGTCGSFTFVVTNGGSQTVNWPASVDWAGGTAPTLTASGVDVLNFFTTDGGTTWYGFVAGLDMQ